MRAIPYTLEVYQIKRWRTRNKRVKSIVFLYKINNKML